MIKIIFLAELLIIINVTSNTENYKKSESNTYMTGRKTPILTAKKTQST